MKNHSISKDINIKGLIRQFTAGLLIGLGCILPGVSGGIIAVAFGIYIPMLDAIEGFFKDMKKSIIYLFPIGAGGVIGVLGGSLFLDKVLDRFFIQVMYLFFGLVIGGIPSFLKEATKEAPFKLRYLIATVLGAGIASLLAFLDTDGQAVEVTSATGSITLLQAALSGAIIAVGAIIPGISTSFILIYLGWYKAIMSAIANLDILTLAFAGAGAAITALLLIKAVGLLFKKASGYAYFGVLGFLFVSLVLIFPGLPQGVTLISSILLLIAGFIATLLMGMALAKPEN